MTVTAIGRTAERGALRPAPEVGLPPSRNAQVVERSEVAAGKRMLLPLVAAVWTLLSSAAPAAAQVSIGIGLPNVSIGINLPVYPQLVPVPGYPVYYAPGLEANYFFYDGMYWVYDGDTWYASSWYDGPWAIVAPQVVPVWVLRVPVRYYRRPPPYFHGWRPEAPPHWGEHWGHDWERHRSGWDRWNRRSAPKPAPLPVYQREYAGDRYPHRLEEQHDLERRHYRYEPRDPAVREHYRAERGGERAEPAPAPARHEKKKPPEQKRTRPEATEGSHPPKKREAKKQEPAATHQPPHEGARNERQGHEPHEHEGGAQRGGTEPEPGHGHEGAHGKDHKKAHKKAEEHGRDQTD